MIKNKTFLFTAILSLCFISQSLFAQKINEKKIPDKISSERMLMNRKSKVKSYTQKKDTYRNTSRKDQSLQKHGSYLLFEDFESDKVPPTGWTSDGTWYSYNVSAFGTGDYSAIYEFYWCPPDNPLTTAFIDPSGAQDTLIFDIAYAGYSWGGDSTFSAMTIYYSTDDGKSFFKLVYLNGDSMKTSPAIEDYFIPENSQWKTLRYILPAGTNRVQFYPESTCSNNLFLDNVRVSEGDGIPNTDIAVSAAYSMGRYPRNFLTNDSIGANIRNTGNQTVTNLKVYLRMTGANTFTDSLILPVINGSENIVVKFRPFTPVINGNSYVKIWIAGGDEDINNDTAYYNTNVNSNYFAYTDTVWTGFYGAIGFFDNVYIVHKFRVTNANSRITEVKIRIFAGGTNAVGQIIKGVILNGAGVVAAKSDAYKIKASDVGNFVSLKITDPVPYYPLTNDSYFYAGCEYTDPVGEEIFWDITGQPEDPPRPDKYFWGFGGIKQVGEAIGFLYNGGGKDGIEAKVESMPAVDVGISNQGNLFDQYYTSAVAPMTGKVFNNALSGTANATVIRKISPGSYTSSVVVSIPANSSLNVTFTDFTFTSGTDYTVRDSIVLSGDVNSDNNVLVNIYQPRIAKELVFMYQKQEDRDSILRAIISDGRYANNYDSININYTGSYRPWKIMFALPKSQRDFLPRVRDSLKSFIDASTALNKKTLVVFGDRTVKGSDPASGEFTGNAADSIFLRQYLKAGYVGENWLSTISASERKFKGMGFFNGITQDSVGDPMFTTAALIKTVNGSSPAFVPGSITGSGTDSAVAVSFSGTNNNSFFMSNRFSDLRSTNSSPTVNIMGPVRVYTKIIDWLQSVNTGAKVMDLTAKLEGFYNPGTNYMVSDTMRIYLRSSVNPFTKVDSAKSFLNSAGQASFVFNNASNGTQYYIQLKHRNGLETWSKTTQSFSSNHLTYNFTTDSAKAFGNNMKKQGSSWVLFTGDVNQDGFIDLTDVVQTYNAASAFVSGYAKTDVNGDGFSDLTDIVITYNNAVKFIQKSIPLSEPEILAQNENDQSIFYLNSAAYNREYLNAEKRIDHQIYDKTKNQIANLKNIPDFKIINKDGSEKFIKGSINMRKNR